MSELKLKSKLISGKDYHEVDLSAFAVPLSLDTDRYNRDLCNFQRHFAVKVQAETVAEQDTVTISCTSENPKFRKNHITLRVGFGLFSKELEGKLIGMNKGETKSFRVGADDVSVCVESVRREVLPELTDEFARSCGIQDIQTAEDIKKHCRFKQYDDILEEPADNAFVELAGKITENSVFQLDERELEASRQLVSALFQSNNVQENDFIDAAQMSESMLKSAVLGESIRTLTDADYAAFIDKKIVATGCTEEEARAKYGRDAYLIEEYDSIFMDTLEAYAFYRLKELGEALTKSQQEEVK